MDKPNEIIITRSGCKFNVRPVCADDEGSLAEFFRHVTPDDIRFRFLTGIIDVGHDRLFAMTHVDHHQTENFIAFIDGESEIIATAMLACDAGLERGEVAIAIRSDFKNDGVGWEMLKLVTRHANSIGVKIIESIESRENHAAIDLEREMGFTATSYPGDATLMLLRRTLGVK